MIYPLSQLSFARIATRARIIAPQVRSCHRHELLAAGFGFGTHNALRTAISTAMVDRSWDDALARARAAEIGSPCLPADVPADPLLRTLGVLAATDAWTLERLADLAQTARREEEQVMAANGVPRMGNMGPIVKGIESLTARGLWPTPAKKRLENTLQAFGTAELCEVMAVMWIGSSRYSPFDWSNRLAHAHDVHGPGSVEYVLDKGLLGEDLMIGMERLWSRAIEQKESAMKVWCVAYCQPTALSLEEDVTVDGSQLRGTSTTVRIAGTPPDNPADYVRPGDTGRITILTPTSDGLGGTNTFIEITLPPRFVRIPHKAEPPLDPIEAGRRRYWDTFIPADWPRALTEPLKVLVEYCRTEEKAGSKRDQARQFLALATNTVQALLALERSERVAIARTFARKLDELRPSGLGIGGEREDDEYRTLENTVSGVARS